MSILNLRAVADTFRLANNLPPLEQHAAILSFALIHPVTGAVVVNVDKNGALVTPNGTFSDAMIVTTSTPTTGFSAAFGTAKSDELLNLTPAGTLATGTVTFPTNTNSRIGQRISVVSSQIVTALTVSSSGLTLRGPAVTTLSANVPISFVKVAASTWQRTDPGDVSNLTSAITITDPTTPSLTTQAGSTNTGFLEVLGKTSGGFKITTADAAAQVVTATLAAQTVGAAALAIPDFASVADTFVFAILAQTLKNKKIGDATDGTKAIAFTLSGATTAKTLTLISAHTNDRSITFPDATDTLVGRATTDTLTNKTVTGNINADTHFCTTQFDAVTGTTGATLTDVVGLTGITLTAGATYAFEIEISGISTTNCGIKLGFHYTTATLTSLESKAIAQAAASMALVHSTTATDAATLIGTNAAAWIGVRITGQIVVNAAGTMSIQAAQNAAHVDTTSVYVGSWARFTRVA